MNRKDNPYYILMNQEPEDEAPRYRLLIEAYERGFADHAKKGCAEECRCFERGTEAQKEERPHRW